MIHLARTLALPLLALPLLLAPPGAPAEAAPSPIALGSGPGSSAGWSFRVVTRKPFYGLGETLSGAFEAFNGSGQDAYGFIPVSGGQGCTYDATLVDALGNTVWEPGSIVNNQFSGPGCLFGSTSVNLTSGASYNGQFSIPLVYQNGGGFGTLGEALPAGAYLVRVRASFAGPKRNSGPSFSPGLSYLSEVPIVIEN